MNKTSYEASGANDAAFPVPPHIGLTKREYAAIKIMAGFAMHGGTCAAAQTAVQWADALLAELAKRGGE